MTVTQPPAREKDPRRVANGRRAMRSRWGPQRIVRLADLDADTARIIRAILAAREHAADAEPAPGSPDRAA